MRQNSEYLMKVITKTYSAHYISTFYYCHWVGAAVGGLLVLQGIIHPVVSVFGTDMVYLIYSDLKLAVSK
jgi:hypothetical protein